MDKKIIPNLGEKHYTATVFIVSKMKPRKFLLTHHIKYDKWMPPGGHIEPMENPVEAAVREVKEESGVDIQAFLKDVKVIDERANILPLPTFLLEERIDPYGDFPEHYHLDFVYVIEVPMQEVNHQIEESHNIGWFSLEEMKDLPMFDNVRHEIDIVLEKLENS
ncbi:NUDIX hydrolase [Candidatus Parcubacteria bacterium]|jgi:8-oxo-dGTP pyrophosphatase MutT (NUDIX family)|nr:NUDIX hydrolase [Candidatus Parcubacteria bacterium]